MALVGEARDSTEHLAPGQEVDQPLYGNPCREDPESRHSPGSRGTQGGTSSQE